MNTTRLYTLLVFLLMAGGVNLQAQQNEPEEIFSWPDILVYHLCQWDEEEILLNGIVFSDGLYVMKMNENGDLLDMAMWHESNNTCSFLTESKFFRLSDGSLCFYYVKGPDHPVVYKVSISEDFELTTVAFPDAFPFPDDVMTEDWWNFAWLPNDDGSLFVSGVYIEGNHCVQMMARYDESGVITHQWAENTSRATTSLLPPAKGASGCRLVMEDLTAKDVNSECVVFDDSLNVVDVKHCIYDQAVGIYRPHYEYFAVHPETDMVYLLSAVNFPPFNGNPEITADIYMSQFAPDFTQRKYVMGPYTLNEYDQIALCEAIDFQEDDVYMCGLMNTPGLGGGDIEKVENFYVAWLDENMNLKGEIYYHNEERMLTPYSILALPKGGCLVTVGGEDRHTFEQQHSIFKLSEAVLVGIEEAHDAGFAVAVAYPNPGKDVLNIRTGLKDARVEVYDLTGRLIYNQEITENITAIKTPSWPSGTYIWKVISNGKEAESGKWIKE